MKEIEVLKTIFKDSPDILEPLNEISKEIERLKNKVKEISEEMNYQINLKTKNANEIYRLTNIINEFDSWLKEKKEQMEEFELYKRKETGAFWYSTMGNIETFIEKINELKGDSSND